MSGAVTLIADGSNYPAGIPGGAPSIFEDPLAVTFALDGTLLVADQLARPTGTGNPGALFRVVPGTGEVSLVATAPQFRGLRDLAVEPSGSLLVLDRIATSTGSLSRLDITTGAVTSMLSATDLVEPSGLAVSGDGRIFLVDAAAAMPGLPGLGLVYEVDATLTTLTAVVASAGFVSPWSIDLLEPISLAGAAPPQGEQGQALTVRLTGGPFQVGATVDFGADVAVLDVRVVDPANLDVDVVVAPGATLGQRNVTVTNPDRTHAFHCDLFEVVAPTACAVTEGVGHSLRVTKAPGDVVVLSWLAPVDACRAAFVVRRAFTARPAAGEGAWPDDPEFANVTGDDLDLDPTDAAFARAADVGRSEYFVVSSRGTDGGEGSSEHYGG
jgi:DNA-binding beta-propeller fold protein YncE